MFRMRRTIGTGDKPRQCGFSLVELMVAITLGLLIVAGLTTLFVKNSQTRAEIERASQQIENGRYAMQLLSDDLHNAGYLAEFDARQLATPAAKPDACAIDLATLTAALPIAVQGYDNGIGAPACLNDVMAGTDILVIRRASTCAVGDPGCDALVAGAPYFQASACNSAAELGSFNVTNHYALNTDTAQLTLHRKDCNPPITPGTLAPIHQYRTHIYFVARNDKIVAGIGDGIPTLKRAELGAEGFAIVPLVEGIQNLQIEYGIDGVDPASGAPAPPAGTPAVYTADPDSYKACVAATCIYYWRNVVAAKITLLARNTTITAGYRDGKNYLLGLKADGSANTVGPFNDGYKRHLYESVVRLDNPAGRNTP
ncbi:MAG: PilW family protein [Betaproteobacteria bacterium]|nr:PilW family protein [Betaproteobacteria bacterium]